MQTEQTIRVIEGRQLVWWFTEDELRELGEDLAAKTLEYGHTEIKKKARMKAYSEDLKKLLADIRYTSKLIDQKFETRLVDCRVEYNEPVYGVKRITRQDTGESWDEDMTDEENRLHGPDLFNTYEEAGCGATIVDCGDVEEGENHEGPLTYERDYPGLPPKSTALWEEE